MYLSADSLLIREVNLFDISIIWSNFISAHMMNNRPNYSLEVLAGTDLEEPTRVIVPLKLQDFPNLHELALVVEAKIYILIHKVRVFHWIRGFIRFKFLIFNT